LDPFYSIGRTALSKAGPQIALHGESAKLVDEAAFPLWPFTHGDFHSNWKIGKRVFF
jgi:hypothetical protein